MANASDNICSKLKKMNLKYSLCDETDVSPMKVSDETESDENKNLVCIDLNPTLNCVGDSLVLDNCSEFTFDNVIGHLEDMLIDEEFHELQSSLLEKYWEEFENNEENKHSYMTIFNEYTNKIEDFIVQYLKLRISNFDMDIFAAELKKRKNTLEGEIFEVLLTLSDFTAFKEIFLDYRAMKEGLTVDLGASLSVSSVHIN